MGSEGSDQKREVVKETRVGVTDSHPWDCDTVPSQHRPRGSRADSREEGEGRKPPGWTWGQDTVPPLSYNYRPNHSAPTHPDWTLLKCQGHKRPGELTQIKETKRETSLSQRRDDQKFQATWGTLSEGMEGGRRG